MEVKESVALTDVPVYKILLVGNCMVGKSSIVNRFCENEFSCTYIPTDEIELKVHYSKSLGKKLKLNLWDISGNSLSAPTHLEKVTKYAKVATGILFIYDISNKDSFGYVQKWIKALEDHIDCAAPQYLIGNKADLHKQRTVLKADAKEFSMENNMRFFETSAKSKQDDEIKSVFCMMIHDMKLQYDKPYCDDYQKEEVTQEESESFSKRCRNVLACCSCFSSPTEN